MVLTLLAVLAVGSALAAPTTAPDSPIVLAFGPGAPRPQGTGAAEAGASTFDALATTGGAEFLGEAAAAAQVNVPGTGVKAAANITDSKRSGATESSPSLLAPREGDKCDRSNYCMVCLNEGYNWCVNESDRLSGYCISKDDKCKSGYAKVTDLSASVDCYYQAGTCEACVECGGGVWGDGSFGGESMRSCVPNRYCGQYVDCYCDDKETCTLGTCDAAVSAGKGENGGRPPGPYDTSSAASFTVSVFALSAMVLAM